MKAEQTWWGKKFSAEEKEVLTHIYERDFDKMLGLLKKAEFNWIWVTWSSGWSFKDETTGDRKVDESDGEILHVQ